MDGDTNIVVCKNKLSNIIKFFPDKSIIRTEYQKYHRDEILEVINDVVIRTNKIVFHTYNFLKLYILHLHDQDLKFPIIDRDFVYMIMTVLTTREEKRGAKPSKDKLAMLSDLTTFYNKFYAPLLTEDDIVSDDKLSYILKNYECVDIVKNIDVNIREHFTDHVRKYVNLFYKIKEKKELIMNNKTLSTAEKKELIRKKNELYNNIKYDILSTDVNCKSDAKYLKTINRIRDAILPYGDFAKDNIIYDIKKSPQNYLKSMIVLNGMIQDLNEKRETDYKIFQVLPLRTSIVPRYITLDTASLVSLFIGKTEYFKNITDKSYEIWRCVFDLDKRCFIRKNHKFIHMIKTDGVACSILLEKLTKAEKEAPRMFHTAVYLDNTVRTRYFREEDKIKMQKEAELDDDDDVVKKKIKRKVHNKEKKDNSKFDYEYIEDVKLTDEQKKMNFAFIDPGHNDLIKCLSGKYDGEEMKEDGTFRYTRKQRNRESKKIRNRKIMDKLKTKKIAKKEAELSNYNSKTCDFKKFKAYLKEKIKLNRELMDHYSQEIYRKLKFNVYTNTRKSESKMIKAFEEKMGKPEETIIVFGDYDKVNTMKGSEPHISKRLKKVFVNNNYKLFLINEHNTSKLCNRCSCVTENVKIESKEIWKLLRCTSEKCLTYHDRDMNATRNMKKIVELLIKGKKRPEKYSSNLKSSAGLIKAR
uniref:Cas12f1-like TNB domain-containing protein n=1 Tax=viral metagenome TaxID=1070528 RepID=A0A6C0CAZ4_9ZZZZ